MTRLRLISRVGCHLCEVAEQELDRIGEPWDRVDVATDLELERDYGDRVPVLLLDGVEHGYFRLDPERLKRDLGKPPGAPRW